MLEMALGMAVLALVAGAVTPVAVRYVRQEAGQKTAREILAVVEAGKAFYVANNRWPAGLPELQSAGHLPSTLAQSPFGTAYDVSSAGSALQVTVSVPTDMAASISRILPLTSGTVSGASTLLTATTPIPGASSDAGLLLHRQGTLVSSTMLGPLELADQSAGGGTNIRSRGAGSMNLFDGKVGIGTENPTARLDVSIHNNANAAAVRVGNISSAGSQRLEGIDFATGPDAIITASIGHQSGPSGAFGAGYGGDSHTYLAARGTGEPFRIYVGDTSEAKFAIGTNGNTGIAYGGNPPYTLTVYRPHITGTAFGVLNYADGVTPTFLVNGYTNPGGVLSNWSSENAVAYVGKAVNNWRSINAAGSVNANGADYAEYFYQETPGSLQRGHLACLAVSRGAARRCEAGAEPLGVVSTNPGYVGNDIFDKRNPDATALIGLMGQVPAEVSTEGGPIKVGDPITFSSLAGVGMKARASDRSIGVALQAFDGANAISALLRGGRRAKTGRILVFVNLGSGHMATAIKALEIQNAHLTREIGSLRRQIESAWAMRGVGTR